jgi:hypothetical protein
VIERQRRDRRYRAFDRASSLAGQTVRAKRQPTISFVSFFVWRRMGPGIIGAELSRWPLPPRLRHRGVPWRVGFRSRRFSVSRANLLKPGASDGKCE